MFGKPEQELERAISDMFEQYKQGIIKLNDVAAQARRRLDAMTHRYLDWCHVAGRELESIALSLEMLSNRSQSEENQRDIDQASSSIGVLIDLVHSVIAEEAEEPGLHEVHKLIRESIEHYIKKAQAKGIEFRDAPDGIDEFKDVVHPGHLGKCFDYLLRNSVDYINEGDSIFVTLKEKQHQALRYWVATIADTGPGITQDKLDQIYLHRSHEPGSQKKRVGCGLPLANLVCECHDGRLVIETSDRGTKVHILIPFSEQDE